MGKTLAIVGLVIAAEMVILLILLARARTGYEDEEGFHFGKPTAGHSPGGDPRFRPNAWLWPRTLLAGLAANALLLGIALWLLS